MPNNPTILVLCTGNSCRSQMAEAFLRKYKSESFTIQSAGTDPKPQIHPLAIRVMREIGIDISHQHPKNLTDFLGKIPIHHVLIVCDNANQTCPRTWPGAFSRTYLPFSDPAQFSGSDDQLLAEFRRSRDEIGKAMRDWTPPPSGKNNP